MEKWIFQISDVSGCIAMRFKGFGFFTFTFNLNLGGNNYAEMRDLQRCKR